MHQLRGRAVRELIEIASSRGGGTAVHVFRTLGAIVSRRWEGFIVVYRRLALRIAPILSATFRGEARREKGRVRRIALHLLLT